MNLIIGSNSKIVCRIADRLTNYKFISHADLGQEDLHAYERIVLFSWSHGSLEENMAMVKSIPAGKLVFISTTAVHALNIRPQWNGYPNSKAAVEHHIRANRLGGIVRLGVIEPAYIACLSGMVPVTTIDMMVSFLNDLPGQLNADEIDLIELQPGGLSGFKGKLFKAINLVGRKYFPPKKLIQIFFEAPVKLLRQAHYGYTADMLDYFQDHLLIGYGALGSRAHRIGNYSGIIVSDLPDVRLMENGFHSTLLGKGKRGLSRYWHGAYIVQKGERLIKRVMPIVQRAHPPIGALNGEVIRLEEAGDFVKVFFKGHGGKLSHILASKVTLACGPLENSRLLNQIARQDVYLSDHEIYFAGSISQQDAIGTGLVARRAGLIARRNEVMRATPDGLDMLVDVRPYVKSRFQENMAFYNSDTIGVVKKILLSQSLARVNEAVFNKFGVGLFTLKYSVFVQVVAKDCIHLDPNCTLQRTRLTDEQLKALSDHLASVFPSFSSNLSSSTLDGQHIMGGTELLNHPAISRLINKGRLKILGSPTAQVLDYRHHTKVLIDDLPNHVM
jgi:hypothetical protein